MRERKSLVCALHQEFAGRAEKSRGFNMNGMLNPFGFSISGSGRNPAEPRQVSPVWSFFAAAIFPGYFLWR
jgi:hypothetical protein